ncbi:RNA methyltransferase [Peptostreptococcus equinus]|uniref:RNA methyltransferase n=1 Tax=Peptostreptococcus equinus TaxID=3003601 RepID=A0ABY7JR59_9FIRM|nr:RNA methyltransferase [Peptostreptococcus sp. CBA3647]WAW15851.1 RNA methyltransferase [Peptostreptococcus sp. CBA3647]
MVIYINSKDNSKFKLAKSLLKTKNRNKEKKYLAEGLRTVELAIQYKADIEFIFISQNFAKNDLNKKNISKFDKYADLYILANDLFQSLSTTENTQGVLSVMRMNSLSIDEIKERDLKKILVLDRVQDPGNVGTIVRTADAAGFDLLIFNKGCVDVYNPKVVRSAMGSMFYMDMAFLEDIQIEKLLKEDNMQIVSSSLDTENYYDKINFKEKVALVVGNEANGISEFWKERSDVLVKIPMYGKAESLNVAISSAILMYVINANK